MNNPLTVALFVSAFTLSGCELMQPVAPKSTLEIQAIQAKMFETDKPTAFKSVLSVLQDLGYIIKAASLDTGVISAQSPTKEDTSRLAFFISLREDGVRSEGTTFVTATVEDFNPKQTRVRLNFVDRRFRSGANGQQATNETPIHDAPIYASAFEKISEAIFIRTAQK